MAYKNKAQRREWERANYAKNREDIRRKNKIWRDANPDKTKRYRKKWIAENPERWTEIQREQGERRSKAKPKSMVAQRRAEVAWLREHDPDEYRRQRMALQMEYQRKRWASDPDFRMERLWRNRARKAVQGKISAADALAMLGADMATVRAHLERGGAKVEWVSRNGWHIDHIRPIASFDMTNPIQRKAALHYTNLQLLLADKNRRKHAKWNGKSWRNGRPTKQEGDT